MRMTGYAAAVLALSLPLAANAAEKIKFSTFGTTRNPIVKCAWLGTAKAIAEKSGGQITLETYLGGTAFGNPRKQYDFLSRGVMDMSAGVLSYKQGAFPLTGLVNLPFMVNDNVKAAIAVNKVVRKSLMDEFRNIHLMFIALVSPYQFHLRKPIADLADLKGRRIRISGKAATESLKALGAQPAPMPITQAYENLQKGVIDGVGGTWTAILAFKLGEVTKFHYEVNFAVPTAFMGMSKKAYQKLPRDVQAAVDSYSTPEHAAKVSNCWARTTAPAKKLARKLGNTIVSASEADRARYRKMLEPVTENILSGLEKRGLPARRIYGEFRRAIAAEENRS
jgi:TRAP-type transport system periplasmic protein